MLSKSTRSLVIVVSVIAVDEDKRLVIKSFGTKPVRLQNIRRSK